MHDHGEAGRYKDLIRCTRICLFVNFLLGFTKLYFGHYFLSKALFADGVHSILDIMTDAFVLYVIRIAHLPKDNKHPYGYFRYETLANIVISLALLSASGVIVIDSLLNLHIPQQLSRPEVLIVASLSIVLNELTYRYARFFATKHHSDLLHATALHQRADAATSMVVLLSAAAAMAGIGWADSLGALLIGCMIAYYTLPPLMRSIYELLDRGLSEEDIKQIALRINSVSGVRDHHLLRSRSMAKLGYVDVHVVVANRISVSEGHYIGEKVRQALLALPNIRDVTIHVDTEHEENEQCALPSREDIESWFLNHDQSGVSAYKTLVVHYIEDKVQCDLYFDCAIQANAVNLVMEAPPSWLGHVRLFVEV